MGKASGAPKNPKPTSKQADRLYDLTCTHRGFVQTYNIAKAEWNETKKGMEAQIEHIEKQMHQVATDIETGQTDMFDAGTQEDEK